MCQKMTRVKLLLQLCLCHFNGLFSVEVNTVMSVMEGDCVTLHTNITELQRNDGIEWTFVQTPDDIIASIYKDSMTSSFIKETLKNHVEIEAQSGSLIITNITTLHTGLYKVAITRNAKLLNFIYGVIVYAHLPVAVISRDCSSSSSVSKCSVLCSVVNVSHVSLSWYKGSSLLSSISVSDLNIRLSLPLEVDYEDTNTHTCVLNNTNMNYTQHLNITQLCHKCPVGVHCCGFTEAVIRLVVSALVGVATVAVLLYDITSRRE